MIILKPCQIVICIYIYIYIYIYLYADDNSIFYQHKDVTEIGNVLNKECADMCEWFVNNNLSIHFLEDESKCILFSKEKTCSSFTWHTITIE